MSVNAILLAPMPSLTPLQNAAVNEARDRWLEWIFSTRAANRKQAEEGVRQTYRAAGLPEPKIFLWFDDQLDALLTLEQLSDFQQFNWMLPPESAQRRERVRRQLRNQLGVRNWAQVNRALGPLHTANRHEERRYKGLVMGVAVPRRDSLQAGLPTSAQNFPSDFPPIEEAAAAVEHAARSYYLQLERIAGQAAGPGIPGHGNIGGVSSIYLDYRFDLLFRHHCLFRICHEPSSALYDGLRRTLQHAGPWWAFEHAAILCDRPRKIHLDPQDQLHHDRAPAITFRSGLELFAWHGTGVPAESICHRESLTPAVIRAQADPAIRAALIDIYGPERFQSERRPPARRKPGSPLVIELPDEPAAKIEVLHGYGPLNYYQRYLAGEHRPVWHELYALGDHVREDRYAADALAVAYATMIRVRQNIVRLAERLAEAGYEFGSAAGNSGNVIPFGVARWNYWLKDATRPGENNPHETAPLHPPEPGLRHRLRRLEKDAGELPISLRAWYEVVGSVTFEGSHPTLSPQGEDEPARPLVVAPFSQILREWDESPPEVGVDGRPFVAVIAPGATPYQMTLPAVGIDAPLENEPHGLLFVDYLRLALNWAGFPRFADAADPPQEIALLRAGQLRV
jgi:hypothetical protein